MRMRAATLLLATIGLAWGPGAESTTVWLRGKPQTVRLAGRRGRPPVIVSSGDGG